MRKGSVLHPFLFPLFPILALYAHNIRSIPIPVREAAWPLAVSLAAAAVLFVALRPAVKSGAKAGLIVSLLAVWFLSYGHLAGQVEAWADGIYDRTLFFGTALLVGLIAALIILSRRTFAGLTRILNVVSVTLVVFNLVTIAQTLAGRHHVVLAEDVKVTGRPAGRPNIYYIVLDAYSRADVLREVFSFDNSSFIKALESRGFVIADRSYTNYGSTAMSLASSLNFTHLDFLSKQIKGTSSDREPVYALIKENRVHAFLKDRGYRFLTASSSFTPTDFRSYDRYFGFARSDSEFLTVLLNTTPLPLFFEFGRDEALYDSHRKRVLYAFQALGESTKEQGPFFMFAHIMSPHPPFVFGPGGEAVEPDYVFTIVDGDRLHGGDEAARNAYIAGYRGQLAFLNGKILEAVDAILKGSAEPPIIILQGDHGSRAYMDFDRPEASYLKENLAILNAYHLPGDGRKLVYPGLSPVNTFRLVFRQYFGADLDLLEDRSAWSSWRRPYHFLIFDEAAYKATPESVRAEVKPEAPVVKKSQPR